jgi:hypothetical protein
MLNVVGSAIGVGLIIVSSRGSNLERSLSPQMALTATAIVPRAVSPLIIFVTTTTPVPIRRTRISYSG